jgi:hypothetical protein
MGTSWQNHDPNRPTLRNAVGAVLDGVLNFADWWCRHFGHLQSEGLSDHHSLPLDADLD